MPHTWPPFFTGLIVGIYWARVMRLVFKSRFKRGRASNFIPPEPLGRVLRIIWYPVVIIWVVHPFAAAWSVWPLAMMRPLYSYMAAAWLGTAIAALALGATLVCWKKMGKSWRMGIDPSEKTQLILTGPYAYVRHPIYALSSLLMIATAVVVPSGLMMIVAAVHLLFLQWESRREEAYLTHQHGAAYEGYRSHVGRFLPRSFSKYQSDLENHDRR